MNGVEEFIESCKKEEFYNNQALERENNNKKSIENKKGTYEYI